MSDPLGTQRLAELKAAHTGWNGMSRNMDWWRRLLGEALAEVERLQTENDSLREGNTT